uniref:ATP synthase F0 subunit 8 n=1 Tax=Ranacris albicornis TaxID=3016386 RepID=UPI00233F6FB7|nr:ATP synthase F0 subunit 8 [Ranacris albicornis]WAX39745.1 ATP synthase F0 subunit 8 [Ranacris albicornis]
MPQMAPMMWFFLFILFSTIFIFLNKMNFFSFKPTLIKNNEKELSKKMKSNWKW